MFDNPFSRKSALINIMSAACTLGSRQLIRDFNELSFLKANRRIDEFVGNAQERTLEIIKTELLRSNKDHGIFAHNKLIKESKTGIFWAVNTIDSIENFTHRLPFFGTCIALLDNIETATKMHNCNIIAGMFFDPIRDEAFFAEQKNGTFLNNKKLILANQSKTQTMKLNQKNETELCPNFIAGIDKKANRNFGSSAMHMAYVAAGRIDSTQEKIDDIANICTGKLLVLEAKGTIHEEKNIITAAG